MGTPNIGVYDILKLDMWFVLKQHYTVGAYDLYTVYDWGVVHSGIPLVGLVAPTLLNLASQDKVGTFPKYPVILLTCSLCTATHTCW